MLRAVADAFNNGDHLLIEAGTGTGKSLAYLLPAIAWSIQNRSRVVISTNTINLQDQLYTKDVPDLLAVFAGLRGQPVEGDSRFQQFARQAGGAAGGPGQGAQQLPLPAAAGRHAQPGRSERRRAAGAGQGAGLAGADNHRRPGRDLSVGRPRGSHLGAAGHAKAARAATERCETSQGGRCFFYRNRRQADSAHLLIVNHALLLSDVAAGNRVLPAYRHLIVDEAHHLEDATTQQLSFSASQPRPGTHAGRRLPGGRRGRGGIVFDVRRRLEKAGLTPTVRQEMER